MNNFSFLSLFGKSQPNSNLEESLSALSLVFLGLLLFGQGKGGRRRRRGYKDILNFWRLVVPTPAYETAKSKDSLSLLNMRKLEMLRTSVAVLLI